MNTSQNSGKMLDCNGRACIACGFCRDWYWRPNGNYKQYIKRNDATCVVNGFDDTGGIDEGPTCVDHGNDNYRVYYHIDWGNGSYGSGPYHGFGVMCQCSSNRA